MDKEMSSTDVKGKRDAARRWANYVNADEQVTVTWRYLLLSETDVNVELVVLAGERHQVF
jgi:hypothetical protein